MKLLVFGQSGQVAQALSRLNTAPLDMTLLSRNQADFSQPKACAEFVHPGYDAVINAVAYTAVDAAETEAETARVINATAPGEIAKACAAADVPMIQLSTDYVFDGSGHGARRPDAVTRPLNIYGKTKLEGEAAVLRSGARAVILRTSWVFSATGSNFVKTMMRLSETHDHLSIVADQIGGPTPARDIAQTCLAIAQGLASGQSGGVYHYAGAPDVSWADFARAIFAAAGRDVAVTDIPTSQYPNPAKRPLNSRLDCSSLARDFGVERPDWRAGLAEVLAHCA